MAAAGPTNCPARACPCACACVCSGPAPTHWPSPLRALRPRCEFPHLPQWLLPLSPPRPSLPRSHPPLP
eukprot:10903669-Alexandrium_andersonii.AAC.1